MPPRLTAVLLLMLPTPVFAQAPAALTRIEAGACPKCTVTLEKLAVLGKETDAELIPEYARLLALRDGSYAVAPTSGERAPILRYDRTGRYLGTIGRMGDGPGEYRSIASIAAARADSISLLGRRRLTTMSVASGRGRSEPIGVEAFFHTVLTDGRVVVNSQAQKEPMFGLLLPAATTATRFGPVPPPLVLPRQGGRTIDDTYATLVAVAPSPSGGFWAGSMYYRHRLQKLMANGTVVRDIQRSPTWFSPFTYAEIDEKMYRLGELRTPRPTVMVGLGVTPTGEVLAVYRVADATWRADPKAPPPHPVGMEYPVEKLVPTGGIGRYVDGVLEAYDETDGSFLGSWRSDALLGQVTPDGLLYVRSEDGDGVVSFTVYRVTVTRAK